MPLRQRFERFTVRLKDKFRRAVGSTPTQSTHSLPDYTLPSIRPLPSIGLLPSNRFLPQSLAISDTSAPAARPASAQSTANVRPGVTSATWSVLERLQQVLTANSGVFGPLRLVIDDLAGCIATYENAAAARRDNAALKTELQELFSTLSKQFTGDVPPAMTTSMDNLCSAIERELDRISTKKERGSARRHWEAKKDLGEVLECYRRIRGHLDRLTLNADRISKPSDALKRCKEWVESTLGETATFLRWFI